MCSGRCLQRHYLCYLRDFVDEPLLNPHSDGHQGAGAPDAGPLTHQLHHTILDVHKLYVTTICLHSRADPVQDFLNFLAYAAPSCDSRCHGTTRICRLLCTGLLICLAHHWIEAANDRHDIR